MFPMTGRVPLYMGIITLSTVLAALTQLWTGFITFGVLALVYEKLSQIGRN